MRRAYAAARLAIFSLAGISPLALAQLSCVPGFACPDSTAPTVSITFPTSGATVSGAINMRATASDDRGVAGVQFRINGVDTGAEDATAPYSASWDTTTAGNGSHTVTAIARDAAGNRTTAVPITVIVSNDPPSPAAAARHEETDAAVTFSGGWETDASGSWSGGSTAYSRTPGAQVSFAFTGTSVTWIGQRDLNGGVARVFVDGVFATELDLFSWSRELRVPVFTARGLSDGSHTLTIEATGLKSQRSLQNCAQHCGPVGLYESADAVVAVDAFDVPAVTISRLQETDPAVTYTGEWGHEAIRRWSGPTAAFAGTAGAQATFSFTGTSIVWIGARGPQTGIARVSLDGVLIGELDTYAPTEQLQAAVFTATGLADADHALTIEVTGRKNAASTDSLIVVDAFDVTSPATRFQDTDPSVSYDTGWFLRNRDKAYSEGTASESATPGARSTFTFTGTSVSWISARGPITGIARVFLDGVFVEEVDTYSPTEAPQKSVFTATGLSAGSHTLTIEVTDRKNAASTDFWILVDAFDVRP